MDSCPFGSYSYLTRDEINARAQKIAEIIRAGDPEGPGAIVYPECIERPYPVVLVVNGVGTSGKDTFVNYCREYAEMCECKSVAAISCVDPVKDAAKVLLRSLDPINYLYVKHRTDSETIIERKGDAYRTLLHDIKEVWNTDGSANEYAVGTALTSALTDDGKKISMIAIYCRETENIDTIVDWITSCGLICLKMLVTSPKVNTSTWTNSSDSAICTDPKYYDIVYDNSGEIEDLWNYAGSFMKALINANSYCGVSVFGSSGDRYQKPEESVSMKEVEPETASSFCTDSDNSVDVETVGS